ncbi:MAG TPA: arsenate reductase ArsC [Planctomycetota bacterium]|nr:arsenate reductase ArsC [Planctomycetota bacterium]
MAAKRRILFLCTGNCCRSPMAEALLRHVSAGRYESLSAGAHPAGFVHDLAIEVLREAGVDVKGLESKHIQDFVPPHGTPPDLVISVCDSAAKECPVFPGKVDRLLWPFPDPIFAMGDREDRLRVFRRVRDSIRTRIEKAIAAGELEPPPAGEGHGRSSGP